MRTVDTLLHHQYMETMWDENCRYSSTPPIHGNKSGDSEVTIIWQLFYSQDRIVLNG